MSAKNIIKQDPSLQQKINDILNLINNSGIENPEGQIFVLLQNSLDFFFKEGIVFSQLLGVSEEDKKLIIEELKVAAAALSLKENLKAENLVEATIYVIFSVLSKGENTDEKSLVNEIITSLEGDSDYIEILKRSAYSEFSEIIRKIKMKTYIKDGLSPHDIYKKLNNIDVSENKFEATSQEKNPLPKAINTPAQNLGK